MKGKVGPAGRSREVLGRGQETVRFTHSRLLLWEPHWGGGTDDGSFHRRPKPWPRSTLVLQLVITGMAEPRAALGGCACGTVSVVVAPAPSLY